MSQHIYAMSIALLAILLSFSFTYLTRTWDKEIEGKKLVYCNLVSQKKELA